MLASLSGPFGLWRFFGLFNFTGRNIDHQFRKLVGVAWTFLL